MARKVPQGPRGPSERMRRLRNRQRRGAIVAPVEVSTDVIEVLLELRWLSDDASDDRRGIGGAIARMLADLARERGQ